MPDEKTTVRVYLSKDRVFMVADIVDFDTKEFPNPGSLEDQRRFLSEEILLVLRGLVHNFGDTLDDSDTFFYDFRKNGIGRLSFKIEIQEETYPVIGEDPC